MKKQKGVSAVMHGYFIERLGLKNNFSTDDRFSTIYWISVLIGTIALSVFLSYDIWLKWFDSPVNRFTTNEPRHISENPFPAITICLNDPISSSVVNLASTLNWEIQNITDEELQILNVVYIMCSWKHKIYDLEKINPDIVFKVLREFTTKCEDTIKQIRWQDTIIENPCSMMQPTFLLNFLCYSFNSLPFHDMYREKLYKLQEIYQIGKKWSTLTSNWNSDDGYKNNTSVPWRTKSTGFWNSIEFIVAQKDYFNGCANKEGFTVYFHNPSDVPDYSHPSVKFSKNTHSLIQVATHLSITDDGIKSWTPEKRECYYSQERWLKHNKMYSYVNCYLECQVNRTESMCGCSPIYRINSSLPVCGPKMSSCQGSATVFTERAYHGCKCLPSCTDFDYTLSYSIVPKNFSYIRNSLAFLNNSTESNNLASIEVSVNYEHTWPLRRNAEETNIGYIGQIAGITNLCRGISLISILEGIYFIFIYPIFH